MTTKKTTLLEIRNGRMQFKSNRGIYYVQWLDTVERLSNATRACSTIADPIPTACAPVELWIEVDVHFGSTSVFSRIDPPAVRALRRLFQNVIRHARI